VGMGLVAALVLRVGGAGDEERPLDVLLPEPLPIVA
jgi:hypothetical protein